MKRSLRIYQIYTLIILAFAFVFSAGSASAVDIASKPAVLLFPFAIGSGVPMAQAELVEQASSDIFLLASDGLTESGRYTVIAFDARLSSLRRAVHEKQIDEKELTDPVDTTLEGAAKARKLAEIAGASYALIGSIDGYSFRESEGKAEITVTAQFIDVETGKVSTVTAMGTGNKAADKPEQTEESIVIAATYDVSQKLMVDVASASTTELTGAPVTAGTEAAAPAQPAPKTRKEKGFIPAMLGALLLGFLISS